MSISGDSIEDAYDTEFRSYLDDAWYSVRVLFEGEFCETVRVQYQNFNSDHDNVFMADRFKSEGEVYDFILRFRKISAQLQDRECSQVEKGLHVCASDSFSDEDVRFYDAIVEDVLHKEHSNVNGEEVCECNFLLYWLHGPKVGDITDKGVADVCIVQSSSEIQPKLESFMKIALQKIEQPLSKYVCATGDDLACNLFAEHEENKGSAIVRQNPSFAGHLKQEKCAPQSLCLMMPSEGTMTRSMIRQEDTDVGGEKNFYMILVQNLEKGLSSSIVSEFIHKETSIDARVYIFPSLPWEPYTNGAIMLDCQKDLERVFGFLQNPNHLIVSLNGRPWVATEKMLLNDHWILMLGSPNKLHDRKSAGYGNELKVVRYGTKEYEKAKEFRDLFLDFIDHQRGLHKKLSMEEMSIS